MPNPPDIEKEMAEVRLRDLREAIDLIDDEWIALLARRFEKTREVGMLKARLGEMPSDPARQKQRARLLATLSRRHGVSLVLIHALFATISAEVVAGHRLALAELARPIS
ncbi:chorismate mutase [Variovorax sp. OV329]|uniref:chorismate mutase n=1 Tax=Variovorax sp. OV329 TaxID=1882825 RepID=UPI0008EFA567|nr:chorismate mutase [Variovorax sp. OV329]SFM92708.1 chorismate mutase [Variovorax sp. OV329]